MASRDISHAAGQRIGLTRRAVTRRFATPATRTLIRAGIHGTVARAVALPNILTGRASGRSPLPIPITLAAPALTRRTLPLATLPLTTLSLTALPLAALPSSTLVAPIWATSTLAPAVAATRAAPASTPFRRAALPLSNLFDADAEIVHPRLHPFRRKLLIPTAGEPAW